MKILLLLITQNVGGVEKRFYNYCKYNNYLLGKRYQIYDKGPKKMKDVNEVLTRKFKQKEEYSR